MPAPRAELLGAYAAFRRADQGTDVVPHVRLGAVSRLVAGDPSRDVYLVSEPAENRFCVVGLLLSAGYGGTACSSDAAPSDEPPTLMLSHQDGPCTLLGAAPDGVIAASLTLADGSTVVAKPEADLYTATVPAGPPPRITLVWQDGRRTSLTR